MPKRMRAMGAAVLGGLLVSAACSSSSSNNGSAGAGGSAGDGASGTTNSGGHSGSTAHGGSGGKAGSSGKGGSGGSDVSQGGGGASAGTGGSSAGSGGEAGAVTVQCANPKCTSGLCFPDGTCVDCLSDDQCPSGQVCGSTNTCVTGCKDDNTSCASGVCADAHDCQSCIGDSECGAGNLCGDNRCAPACTADQQGTNAGCGTGLTCCGLHCIDAETDSQNCGACGSPCADGQFCGLTACAGGEAGAGGQAGTSACVACHDTTLANICALPKVAVVLDGQDGNQVPGRAMAAALAAQCTPAPTIREVSQTVPDALNPSNGRPVSGAHELLVAAGGSYYARLLGYVDAQKISPIYWHYDGVTTIEFRKNSNDEVVVTRQTTEDNTMHDFFVIQLMRDPTSGSLVLNAEGFWESGTVAAAYFFANGILPNLNTFDKSWYVYEWTDKDGDLAPDVDEMKLVSSGP